MRKSLRGTLSKVLSLWCCKKKLIVAQTSNFVWSGVVFYPHVLFTNLLLLFIEKYFSINKTSKLFVYCSILFVSYHWRYKQLDRINYVTIIIWLQWTSRCWTRWPRLRAVFYRKECISKGSVAIYICAHGTSCSCTWCPMHGEPWATQAGCMFCTLVC